jgi:hypothetical protein
MTAKRGYYSLVQFCPDPSRAEAVNVGVLLFCPEEQFIGVRTAAGNRRAARLVGQTGIDSASLNAAKTAIERRLEVDREGFQTLEDLQRFVDTRANVLKLTDPRPVKVFAPDEDLRKLFEQLVGGSARRKQAMAFPPPELQHVFQELEKQGRARLNWNVEIPVVRRGLRIPYAYRNGVWNLVRPRVFSNDEGPAIGQAQQLAVDGDLLRRHGADKEGEKRLVVLTAFETGENVVDLENRLVDLFREYEVTTVRQHDVPEFLTQVKQQAHPVEQQPH